MNEHGGLKTKSLDLLEIVTHIEQRDQLNAELAALSVVDNHFQIDKLSIKVYVGAAAATMTPGDQKLLDDRLAESRAITEKAKGISTEPPPAG